MQGINSYTIMKITTATFFLLSYTKLMYNSLYFLIYLHIQLDGSPYKTVLGIDPSFVYFSKDHAPFAVFFVFILILPVLLPTVVLAFYPVRAFRLLLEKCRFSGHSRAGLNQFVEKFCSCYRDGLDGGEVSFYSLSFLGLRFFLRLPYRNKLYSTFFFLGEPVFRFPYLDKIFPSIFSSLIG